MRHRLWALAFAAPLAGLVQAAPLRSSQSSDALLCVSKRARVAGFLAVFAGFYYAVVSATDPAMRQGVRDTVTESIREACATRAALLAITAGGEGGSKTAR